MLNLGPELVKIWDKIRVETIRLLFSTPGVSFAGSVLTLGQGDTGQLGLGEDVMERSKPGLVKEIDAKVTTVVAG